MAQLRIFLVRHGETEANVDQQVYRTKADHAVELTATGLAQATAAGEFLHDYLSKTRSPWPWGQGRKVRLWHSPYTRTRQTADAIWAACNPAGARPLLADRREDILLCEQQFGLFDGIPDAELPLLYPAEHDHYAKCEAHGGRFWARMPLGESRFDTAMRIKAMFGTFVRDADRHGIHDIIVVCHGVTLRAFVMQWLHHPFEWFDREKNPGNCWIRLLEGHVDHGYLYQGGPGREKA